MPVGTPTPGQRPTLRPVALRLLAVLCCLARLPLAHGAAGEAAVTVVGPPAPGLQRALADLRLPWRAVSRLREVPAGTQSLLVLAEAYPRPRTLTPGDQAALEALVRGGTRAFVEFAQPAGGSWLGVGFAGETRRPLYERLVMLCPLGSLRPEDLLEEHDTACLPFAALPPGAEVLAEYDRCLGTYERFPRPETGVYTVTVDLGEARPLALVSQRYGAGEPNYRPESVELYVSADGTDYGRAGGAAQAAGEEVVRFALDGRPVRYLRLKLRKFRRSPVTDFLFLGELEARDTAGANRARGCPYTLSPADAQADSYRDDGGRLTDGVLEGHWRDRLSVGFATTAPPEDRRAPALVRMPCGQGEVLLSALPLFDYARRRFRLTARWQELCRQVVLATVPPSRQPAVAARHVPLEAHTEPRVWVEPGTEVRLVVQTAAGAQARAEANGKPLALVARGQGRWEGALTVPAGGHCFRVTSRTATGQAATTVPLDCRPRRQKYRQVLDRNLSWFTRSGVLPDPSGRGGIYSQVCLAWLDSKPVGYDFLPSPFRVDCNAMSAEAFYLYGLVSGQERYKALACNLMDTVVAHQYTDAGRPSLGAFPWLYDKCDTIYFWDDNSRIGVALLWLYYWTGRESYLRAALLGGELFRQVAREDGCVHRHDIGRGDLDRLGREDYRQFSQGADPDYRLTHWFGLAAVTGDGIYGGLGRQVLATSGGGQEGLAHAVRYTGDEQARRQLHAIAESFLASPAVRRYGLPLAGGGEYAYAFEGDSGIATRSDPPEPLCDQIYGTPWQFRAALRAWRATGDASCRRMCEHLGDYLVRLQYADEDPRLDGCFMRGFDLEHWEYYGAPYDPAYGPYSAYTGWMNAVAAQAFAWYLLDEEPFLQPRTDARAAAMLRAARAQNPPLLSDGTNLALGKPYALTEPPSGAYGDDGRKLTDGVIDGAYEDHRSVGWGLAAVGQTLQRTMTLDLGAAQQLALITQQYGAGRGTYNPNTVRVLASDDGREYRAVGEQRFGREGAGLLWLKPAAPLRARYLRFELTKQRRDGETDFLFVGETKAYGLDR